jgi:hypothetical protein
MFFHLAANQVSYGRELFSFPVPATLCLAEIFLPAA